MPEGASILLVEDDPDQVQALTVILESQGHKVIVANISSGETDKQFYEESLLRE